MNPDGHESMESVPSLLTPVEVARALQIKPQTLAAWRSRSPERLPFVKIGNLVRYRPSAVESLLEAKE